MSLEVVRQVKAELERRGERLVGPCGAFAITQRVAWRLRGGGAGLLEKFSGNNCLGYAVDIVAFQDGLARDCLQDAGGANIPAWNVSDEIAPIRWRAAIDPRDDAPAPPADAPPAPPDRPAQEKLVDLLQRLVLADEQLVREIQALNTRIDAWQTRGLQVHR